MNRTYNFSVDNGLFVLADYLNKKVNDITKVDIENEKNIEHFAELIEKVLNTEKYGILASSSFQNSSYTQALKKNKEKTKIIEDRKTKVQNQFKDIINNKNNIRDTCYICGNKSVPEYNENFISSLSKSLMPRLASNTFFNYSNNLKQQNVCPTCLYLSMLSFLNIYPIGKQCVLFNSDNDEFMEDYTKEHINQIKKDILLNAKMDKKSKYIAEITDLIKQSINNNNIYDGYIEIVLFYNGSQSETYNTDILKKKDVLFIKELQSISLLSEFEHNGLFYNLIKGTLQRNYLQYVFDKKDNKLKVSKELFNIIEMRYNKLKKDKLELIKRVSKQVSKNISKDITKEFRGIDKLNQFEKLLISWMENIPNLITTDEFDELCNIKEFQSTKNRMYVELINLENEGDR